MASANRRKGPGRVAVATASGIVAAGFMWMIVSGPQPSSASADPNGGSTVAQNQQNFQNPTTSRRSRQSSGVGSLQSPFGGSGDDGSPFFQQPGTNSQSPSSSLQSPSTSQQSPFSVRPRLRSRGS